MIKIGIIEGSEGIITERRCYLGCDKSSKITFTGSCTIAAGSTLKAIHGGDLSIGNNVSFNYHTTVLCKKQIIIGNCVMTGWNVLISDGDGHPVYNSHGTRMNEDKTIVIGNNVWLGANSTILKGANVNDGSIVGMGSIVNKGFSESNVIIAGIPGKIVKKDVFWHV